MKTFLQNRLAFAGKEENYVLILAPIKAIHETDFGGRIELLHLPEFTFWLSQHVLNSIQRRFERELGALNATPDKKSVQDDRVVGLFKIAALKNKVDQLRILDAGLLRVTPDWIPVHSSYESILARALVGQQRYFQKPLRYDADTETVFPDFLLTDCGAVPVPLEVFGFTNNPTYESRKQAKLNYYRSLDAPFWCWDVTLHGKTENDLPPLPKPQFSEPRSAIATETRLGRVLEISASPAESSSATSN